MLIRLAVVLTALVAVACAGIAVGDEATEVSGRLAAPGSAAVVVPALARTSQVVVVAHNAGDHLGVARRDLSAGADVVEIDVRSAGNELIAKHSPAPPLLEDVLFHGPSLQQAWHVAARRPTVLLHLKERSPGYLALVAAFLRRQPPRHLIVQTDDLATLRWVARALPRAQRLLLLLHATQVGALRAHPAQAAAIDGLSIRDTFATPALLTWARGHALRTFVWTVNDPARAEQLVRQGVDGIITDRPAMFR